MVDPWVAFLSCPFGEIEPYRAYVEDRSPFATHQGVKGREFPRVMVVINDSASRGVMFSYEKLFGLKAKSKSPAAIYSRPRLVWRERGRTSRVRVRWLRWYRGCG